MNKNLMLVGLVVVVLVGVVIWHFSKKQATMAPMPTPVAAEVSPTVMPEMSPAATTGTTDSFTVEGSNFKFSPSTLKVKKGDTVKITFSNTGGSHDFVIDEYNVKTDVIKSGQTADVQFVADKTGTFDYYCSVGNHRAMGMQGTLTVE